MSAATQATAVVGWRAFAVARDRAIRGLRGRVLEIGAGDGANFGQLSAGVAWVGLEPSLQRRTALGENARRHGHEAAPIAAPAESIPLPDASMDSVLATTVMCSVDDQAQVLAEVARVLVPGGRLVLAEHVAAAPGTAIRTLQRLARPWTRLLDHGCDPVRDTESAVRDSALRMDASRRFLIPVLGRVQVPFVVIEATKQAGGGTSASAQEA
ncbi:class I SAM-dependent methyltransferase [Pseudactinotalea suaedae]|uniref:class I SAM-dependent methyltransferase n=1 Tax=Pseudactinotalea suaedae TaxID=1524924 RepID=UPI0012E2ADC8|nr:class I SAM-dependent methyltransferase [Pseudactinotalea suaedae]